MVRMNIAEVAEQIKNHKVEVRPINDLMPYVRNSRTHEEWQINQIAASIKEFGFTNPVLIDEQGTIIAGHARVLASMKLNLEEVPCVVLSHLTEAQQRALVMVDNRLGDTSSWDKEMLQLELSDLAIQHPEIELSLMGFSPTEVEELSLSTFVPDLPDDDQQIDDGGEEKFVLRIEFDTDDERQAVFEELKDRGLRVKV
jgi:ParB-like chromosome segregation protein Spo0J